ncbi:alanine and arginine-rich domain-containing protein [Manis pentadactyla]|uniref:alanine and arginine-rich domain-containing protein n=1 Tax=Manis pentadactyla TaxID=143292 RepID=UPI0018758DF2|nr:alanine and arginine-rich domain-containing protein [Manis pentadactyla]
MSRKLRPRVSEMGPRQSGRRRAGTSWGPPGVSVRRGPCPPALRPARQVPGGSQSADVQAEAPATSRRLEDLRRRLLRAVQWVVPRGHSRRSQVQAAAAAAAAAREQEGRARVELVSARGGGARGALSGDPRAWEADGAFRRAGETRAAATGSQALAVDLAWTRLVSDTAWPPPPRRHRGGKRSAGPGAAAPLEMHFQNLQLARTLLDLDIKMEQLKKEYELEIASEFQSSEDNAGNLE